ncbi:hypothetical protein GCM10018980_76170 [Streptomyces capoamus]|uniref:Uncharacterized protein n=1 Tax=Streptomyces capoamus TaxID=68183 RepID=A0A919KG90_9ACTN|nr:hypothetical protein [Streptomyces capoamus]GGW15061.1 hypothetical protein GCM10010501_25570 [Streptomyces libani subsp. rufus]GHG77674.1 hypothetical protein GCM10018980_76170 [Streptomyces capoamus]
MRSEGNKITCNKATATVKVKRHGENCRHDYGDNGDCGNSYSGDERDDPHVTTAG